MTFPNNASSPPPAWAISPVPNASTDTEGEVMQHADYDLQPLAVAGLAHYLATPEEGERFHVH
jgi:hypothetical protein